MSKIPIPIPIGGKKFQIPFLIPSNKYFSDADSDSDSNSGKSGIFMSKILILKGGKKFQNLILIPTKKYFKDADSDSDSAES